MQYGRHAQFCSHTKRECFHERQPLFCTRFQDCCFEFPPDYTCTSTFYSGTISHPFRLAPPLYSSITGHLLWMKRGKFLYKRPINSGKWNQSEIIEWALSQFEQNSINLLLKRKLNKKQQVKFLLNLNMRFCLGAS